jgi:AP-1 complex subunit gamma-1
MLSIAGATLPDERISNSLISLIQRTPSEHGYVVHKLLWALHDDITQLALVHVGIWCVGEYGALLLVDPPASEDGSLADKAKGVTEASVVDLFRKILRYHAATEVTKAYALNAALKLTTRFSGPTEIQRLRQLIGSFNNSMIVELQQRACEYTTLSESRWDPLRPGILATMPTIDLSKVRVRQARVDGDVVAFHGDLMDSGAMDSPPPSSSSLEKPKAVEAPSKATQNLLDLDDIFGTGSSSAPAASAPAPAAAPASVDLLADLFSTGPAAPTPGPTPAPSSSSAAPDLLGLLDFGAPAAPPAPPKNVQLRAYEKNGLTVDLELSKPNKDDPSMTFITATIINNSPVSLASFVFLAAFPKYIKLKMEPPSGDSLATGGGTITQVVKIQNTMHGEVCRLYPFSGHAWVLNECLSFTNSETSAHANPRRISRERQQGRRHGRRELVPGQLLDPLYQGWKEPLLLGE